MFINYFADFKNNFFKKKINLMCFKIKNTLKSNCYHTLKYLDLCV